MTSVPTATSGNRAAKAMARVVNPMMVKMAGSRRISMQARLTHRGRKSGKSYSIPVNAQLTKRGFIVPMPYGETVDWYRNVVAAGECVIRRKGVDYRCSSLEVITLGSLQSGDFSAFERLFIKFAGVEQFLLLREVQALR
jgi:hypothetical protein